MYIYIHLFSETLQFEIYIKYSYSMYKRNTDSKVKHNANNLVENYVNSINLHPFSVRINLL